MKITLLASLAAVGMAVSAPAATVNWDLTSGSPSYSGTAGSGYGNSYTFTSGGVTITATAWGVTGNSKTTFQSGEAGLWSIGMGVCDQLEGRGCSSPEHQVDNNGAYDFMLFQFSTALDPTTITIDPYGTYDRDVTYYTGNTAAHLNLAGVTLGGLSALGFGSAINDDSTVSGSARTVTLTSGAVNSLLIGARVGGDNSPDYFKISGLQTASVNINAVPEPASFALLGVALTGLGLIGRIRRSNN